MLFLKVCYNVFEMKYIDYGNEIIEKLNSNGFLGYFVGGCVRDTLMGKTPTDFDITTNAKPEEILEIFKDYKTIDIGKKFGTIIISSGKFSIEVTTFRSDGIYLDGRKPEEVTFSTSLEEDLMRRDFTINAMAFDSSLKVIDLFGGVEDLKNRVIKTVGDPYERFKEDYLRILRGVRFASTLDFFIEDNTLDAMGELAPNILKLSKERIRDEFSKILLSNNPSKGLNLLMELGILTDIIPPLREIIGYNQRTYHHYLDLFDHTLCVVENLEPKLHLRLAGLFHDIAKPRTFSIEEEGHAHFYGHDKLGSVMAEEVLRDLRYPNDLIDRVKKIIGEHMRVQSEISDRALRRQILRVGEENIYDLLDFFIADRLCTAHFAEIDFLKEAKIRVKNLLEEEDIGKKNFLKVNGNDIINLGFSQGPQVGQILNYLTERVIEDPTLNKREILLKIIEEYR